MLEKIWVGSQHSMGPYLLLNYEGIDVMKDAK
jgi:hypothetical protein